MIKKIGFCLFFTTSIVLIDYVVFKLKILNGDFSLWNAILIGISGSITALIFASKKKKNKENTDEK